LKKNEEEKGNKGLKIINDLVDKIEVPKEYIEERKGRGLDLIDPEYITFTVTRTERKKI
jgi:cell division protein FtsB